MRRSDLRRTLQSSLRDLTGVAVDLDEILTALDLCEGAGGGGGQGERVQSSSISDPTAMAAIRGDDPARADRAELDRTLADLMVTARRLRELGQRWTSTRPEGLPPRCEVMHAVGTWERRHRTVVVAGEQRVLGRWASDWYDRHGRLPTKREARAHAEGRKVRATAA